MHTRHHSFPSWLALLLLKSRPLQLTLRFGQKVQDNATLDLEKCPAIIKVQILYEFKDRGSTLRDQNAIAVSSSQRDITLLDVNGDVELPIFEFWKTSLRETLEAGCMAAMEAEHYLQEIGLLEGG
ncbi:hypothetical protein CMV_025378 [Castanea mollissima]|uniref:Uncharacterized protein n=1 Tax=Castanea mollissima TaxID=60419 RepID=A0A8J4QCQ4_9ROSI|nr:hypothetical protein CMV_025378 [Castanea mollissima]